MSVLAPPLIGAVEAAVTEAEGGVFRVSETSPVGGGCISRSFRVGDGRRAYLVKVARNGDRQHAAEADGLQALARCDALVVPRVVAWGRDEAASFLVLEWLDLEHQGDETRLGEALAALHGMTYPRFGWDADNFIGSTPQDNSWEKDWVRFYRERRLLPQLRLAAARGAPRLLPLAMPVLDSLPSWFADYVPAPSLVHGDLWSGNMAFTGGRPCVFDPAVYAGDPETDLAMSELFGGFSAAFYAGYPRRRPLYQLYHVLNHFNLFGGGYANQAEELIPRLCNT